MNVKTKASKDIETYKFDYKGYQVKVVFDLETLQDGYHEVITSTQTPDGTYYTKSMMLHNLIEMVISKELVLESFAEQCIASYNNNGAKQIKPKSIKKQQSRDGIKKKRNVNPGG